MKTEFTQKVLDFRLKIGLEVSPMPRLLSSNETSFYARFIMEEMSELLLAHEKRDLVDAADSIGDLIYMLTGCALNMGLPIDEILSAIHKSNMHKVPGVSKRGQFDAVKLPAWRGPEEEISQLLHAENLQYELALSEAPPK